MRAAAPDIEENICGAILSSQPKHTVIFSILTSPDCFTEQRYRSIFAAAQELFHTDQPVDLINVTEQMRRDNTLVQSGGEAGVVGIMSNYAVSNIEQSALLLKQYWVKRRLHILAQQVSAQCQESGSDVFAIMAQYRQEHEAIEREIERQREHSWTDTLKEIYQDIESLSENDSIPGISTGLSAVDAATGGLLKSELIILAARPGMGKTAMAVKWVVSALKAKKPVAVFQLEMSHLQFGKRILALLSPHLHANQLYKHGLHKDAHWQQLQEVIDEAAPFPLHVVPRPGMNIFDCMIEARRLHAKYNLELIVIDYLQLMAGSAKQRSGNREQEISEVSRNLKKLSMELDIPVVALSQLSRSLETRGGDKRPRLTDLRESGSIEQDADVVVFLYRPSYYGQTHDDTGQDISRHCEVIVSKHRNGALGVCTVAFDDNRIKFSNLEEAPQLSPEESSQPF